MSEFQERRSSERGDRPFRRGSSRSGGARKFSKKKGVVVPPERLVSVDYKDIDLIGKFVTDRGKVLPRSQSGLSAKKQRLVARAVRKARAAGLMKVAG